MAKNSNGTYDTYYRRRRNQRRRNGQGVPKHGGSTSSKNDGPSVPLWLKLGLAVGLLGAVAVGAVIVASIIVYNSYADDLLAPDELAINQPSYGAVIMDRTGKVLYEYVDDKAGLRRPTPLEEIAPAFLAATIATEDDSFFTNPGVNIRGLARAAWENSPFGDTDLFGGSGGSSITQQLVKNVYISEEERQERWSKEGISRKLKETIYALELTERYEKDRILEWYVNQISYGGVFNGVEAASLGYFGKSAQQLTLAEAALLAGIPQSPAAYDPVNRPEAAEKRRNAILDLMLRQSPVQIGDNQFFNVTAADVAAAKREPIEIEEAQFEIEAPHWILSYIEPQLRELLGCPSILEMRLEVIEGTREPLLGRPGEGCLPLFTEGLQVTTTLDLELQDRTLEIMEASIEEYEEISNSHDGAMMISDPKTGEILVMIGSRDYNRDDELVEGRNNNAIACNSPGSSFKPFAYLTTFEYLGWGPESIILDTPVEYDNGPGEEPFVPRNPGGGYVGPVTIRYALGNSLNIPANRAAAAVGAENIVDEARKVGFVDTFRLDGCSNQGGYGPAIATGGVDVTLDEMMFGYSVLANGGIMRGQEPIKPHDSDEREVDPVSFLRIVDNQGAVLWDIEEKRKEVQVIDAGYAWLVWSILSDPTAHCVTFGGCGAISIPGYTAGVKTGTSEPFPTGHPCAGGIGETWAFGLSPDLVVGIWAGNADNACIDHIYSTSISLHAVKEAFPLAHEGIEVTPYPRPESVVEKEFCLPSNLKPTELCGLIGKGLFVETDVPEEDQPEDTWWQEVEIDIRNGKLATSATPNQYRLEKPMLVLPDAWLGTGELEQEGEQSNPGDSEDNEKTPINEKILEWAEANNIDIAPTEESDGRGTVGGGSAGTPRDEAAIYSPINGGKVRGLVQVVGRATVSGFEEYRLEFGAGDDPDAWTTIVEVPLRQSGGTIGVWNTNDLEPGEYTLRLTVEDDDGEEYSAWVTVEVLGPPGSSDD